MPSKMEQDNELPFVSVIVPTLNRKSWLENCLASLFRVDYPESKFEVIVVDGGSVDGTREMICRRFPKVKSIIEERKGIPYARNTGWKHAKGLIVAYTDDDCVIDRCWLRSLVTGFTSTEIGGVTGAMLHLHPRLMPEKLEGTPFGQFYLGEGKRLVKTFVGANFAVRREVFEKTRFDTSLTYHAMEDVDFCRSMMESGYKLLYNPDAKVYHDLDQKRLTLSRILKRAFFAGISLYIVEKKRSTRIMLFPKFLRSFLGAFLSFFRTRKFANFFWLVKSFIAFLASIYS